MSISIHALREESDDTKSATAHAALISIHALREESDQLALDGSNIYDGFQSTLSVRRATMSSDLVLTKDQFQSTLSVRRATESSVWRPPGVTISIHALREESDFVVSSISSQQKFQSTLSVRRATWRGFECVGHLLFQSTLSVRRATVRTKSGVLCTYFNPRSP